MAQLVRYDEARRALQLAATVDEAKDIRDKAEALRIYAQQRGDAQMEAWVAEIKLRATIRIGELSAELERTPGPGRGRKRINTDVNSFPTKTEALKAAGITPMTANRYERLAEHKNEVERYIQQKAGQGKPVKITEAIAAIEAVAREAQRRENLHRPVEASLPVGLRHGDFREVFAKVPEESVELVFTDPPYDRESVPLYEAAAEVAARILKPGGSFLAYTGQVFLPDVLAGCSKHLRYFWVCASVAPASEQAMRRFGIQSKWKPIVWFTKGTRGDAQTWTRDVVIGPQEKDSHEWQQSEVDAAYYIEQLTSEHGVVADFFAGGGTTIVAAERLGRTYIAAEINAASCEKIAARLAARKDAA